MANVSRVFFAPRIAATIALSLCASEVVASETEQCFDAAVCPISYVRLSKQETEPFLFLGKEVDAKHPQANNYGSAIRLFPDVRSCLTTEERDELTPDLRKIDWGAISDIREIEVCVFRIAASIEDVDIIRLWLIHQQFKVGEVSQIRSLAYSPKYETDPIFQMTSSLSIENFRKIVRKSWLPRILEFEIGIRFYLYIEFSKGGQVTGVSSWIASKLNH